MSFSVCSQHWKMTAPQTEKARAMIVRKLRLKRGWSQGQLAEMAGVTTRTIQRIEQGHRSSMETSKALASVFEVELSLIQPEDEQMRDETDRKSTRLNSSHVAISYAVFGLK